MKPLKYLSILYLLTSQLVFSQNNSKQDTVFIDENLNEINSIIYFNKCKKYAFKCFDYITDSLIIHKINNKYSFGKLNPTQNKQLRNYLIRKSKITISKKNAIIIRYEDSLRTFRNKFDIYLYKFKKHETTDKLVKLNIHHKQYDFKSYKNRLLREERRRNKCSKKIEEKQLINVINFYNFNESKKIKSNWIKDIGVIKNTFFKVINNYHYVLLKPNGDYFLCSGHLSDKNLNKLIKSNNWEKYKKQLIKSKFSSNGSGIFSQPEIYSHTKHCF